MADPVVTVFVEHAFGSIKGFFVDCLLADNHTFDAEVTDFPVESGSTISDNIRNKPLVVVMECLVSATPIGQIVTLRGQDKTPMLTAYNLMLGIRDSRTPVTIFTSLQVYTNMALQNLSMPREAGRGEDLRFTATFKQIETVVNKRDKRVAIVGAKNGGASVHTPGRVELGGTEGQFIYTLDHTWYDFNINSWRKLVKRDPFVKGAPATAPIKPGPTVAGPGQHILVRGRPTLLTQATWDKMVPAQRTDSAVFAELTRRFGPRSFGDSLAVRQDRYVVLITPSMYVFERGDPATPGGSPFGTTVDEETIGRD